MYCYSSLWLCNFVSFIKEAWVLVCQCVFYNCVIWSNERLPLSSNLVSISINFIMKERRQKCGWYTKQTRQVGCGSICKIRDSSFLGFNPISTAKNCVSRACKIQAELNGQWPGSAWLKLHIQMSWCPFVFLPLNVRRTSLLCHCSPVALWESNVCRSPGASVEQQRGDSAQLSPWRNTESGSMANSCPWRKDLVTKTYYCYSFPWEIERCLRNVVLRSTASTCNCKLVAYIYVFYFLLW